MADHSVKIDGRKGREISDSCAAALQRKRILSAQVPKAPSNRQQRAAGGRSNSQAELDREPALFGRVAQEKSETKEEKDDADPCEGVATDEE